MGPMGHDISIGFGVFVFAHVTTTLLGRQGQLPGVCTSQGFHQRSFQMHALRIGQWKGGHKLNSRVVQTEKRRSQLDSRGVQKERGFETQLLRVILWTHRMRV